MKSENWLRYWGMTDWTDFRIVLSHEVCHWLSLVTAIAGGVWLGLWLASKTTKWWLG